MQLEQVASVKAIYSVDSCKDTFFYHYFQGKQGAVNDVCIIAENACV